MAATDTEHPIDVSPWALDATNIARKHARRIELRTAILDDWNSVPGLRGPRIIYDTPFAEQCLAGGDCAQCPVLQTVGADDEYDRENLRLRSTLCRARDRHHAILPTRQPMLNCKTRQHYCDAFVAFVVKCCATADSLNAELDWIRGFRLIYDAESVNSPEIIAEREQIMKEGIIRTVLAQFSTECDAERLQIVRSHAQRWLPGALAL